MCRKIFFLSIYLSIYPSIHLYLSICLSIYLSIYLYLSIYVGGHLGEQRRYSGERVYEGSYLFSLSISIYLSIYLSIMLTHVPDVLTYIHRERWFRAQGFLPPPPTSFSCWAAIGPRRSGFSMLIGQDAPLGRTFAARTCVCVRT